MYKHISKLEKDIMKDDLKTEEKNTIQMC